MVLCLVHGDRWSNSNEFTVISLVEELLVHVVLQRASSFVGKPVAQRATSLKRAALYNAQIVYDSITFEASLLIGPLIVRVKMLPAKTSTNESSEKAFGNNENRDI